MTTPHEAAAQVAWDAAKPRSRARDKHGREELLMHPFLTQGCAAPRLIERQNGAGETQETSRDTA